MLPVGVVDWVMRIRLGVIGTESVQMPIEQIVANAAVPIILGLGFSRPYSSLGSLVMSFSRSFGGVA